MLKVGYLKGSIYSTNLSELTTVELLELLQQLKNEMVVRAKHG